MRERHRSGDSPHTISDSCSTTTSESTHAHPASPQQHKLISTMIDRQLSISYLDICDPDSPISRSEFRGMFVLVHVLCGVYLIANPLYNMYEKGYLIETTLARAMFDEFFILMAAWAACFGWAFSAYLLFKAMIREIIPLKLIYVIQHLNQAVFILGAIWLIRWRGWAVFPSVFVLTVVLIMYMKMHSYIACTSDILESGGAKVVENFPTACTFGNYFTYLLCPVLVYEISFPKAKHSFRLAYFLHKTLHLIGTLALIYTIVSQMVIPIFESSLDRSLAYLWARLIVPLSVLDFLFFYMMFECILNMLSELTQYGDRSYYDDFWNCTTWDDFARKWNKPVHEFLLCHVYISAYRVTKKSKFYASVSTFLFSAILHETFLATCLGLVRGWMFGMMLCQIPLMALSRYHKHSPWGNYYFWFGLLCGVPLLTTLYGREWAQAMYSSNPP